MSLTIKDKETVRAIWSKVSKQSNEIGPDALIRMLSIYPQTKTYFAQWGDLSVNSAKVREHGKVIFNSLNVAVTKMDNLIQGLTELSQKHAFQLRVDPTNFRLLFQCIHVAIAIRFKDDYTPEAHLAVDKFLNNVALALAEKYRQTEELEQRQGGKK